MSHTKLVSKLRRSMMSVSFQFVSSDYFV